MGALIRLCSLLRAQPAPAQAKKAIKLDERILLQLQFALAA
jgi:hypothetical protein